MNEVALSGAGLMPRTQEEKYQLASVLSKSGLIPQGLNSPEKVFVALQWGHELGLSPMVAVNNVAVINGRPTLSADIMSAVVRRSSEYGGIEWIKNTDTEAECKITRLLPNGDKETIISSFTIEDAQKAGLATRDNWKKYPKRMLKHRCLSYGLRDMFPDILAGLYDPEEMESVQPEKTAPTTERNVTPVEEIKKEDVMKQNGMLSASELAEAQDKQKLKNIIEKYEDIMTRPEQKPTPYDQCCEAIAENDPEKISNMLNRTIGWLGRQGIKVA